jgi:hypothetical protein
MNINLKLSEESINSAIQKLEDVRNNLEDDVGELVDILLTEGAEIANGSYNGMAVAWGERDSEDKGIVTGHIGVTGEDEDTVYIAEFGAGDDTTKVNFENAGNLPIQVYPGAYSESPKGKKQYSTQGWWQFGGASYRYVEPRMGLYNAKMMILSQGNDIAKGVILHDQH